MSESELQGSQAAGDPASSRRDEELDYLKGYVRNHPGNRMAWFLLGKAYTGKGMDAKANYCYIKSGSIYEAYENSIHPLMLEDKSPHEILESWNRKRNRRQAAVRLVLSAVVGLLLLLLLAPKLQEGTKPVVIQRRTLLRSHPHLGLERARISSSTPSGFSGAHPLDGRQGFWKRSV